MSLFENFFDSTVNLIPQGGTVNYYGTVFNEEDSQHYFNYLLNEIPWKADQAVIFGKVIETKRKVAWFGDREFEYTYSGRTKRAMIWTRELVELKEKVEDITGETFNSCLLNLYHDGSEGMAWHSDAEKDLKKNGAIASLTFGAERKFSFKHKISKEKVDIQLSNGSMLVMKGETQKHWLHSLPPTKKVHAPRINLTFRTVTQ